MAQFIESVIRKSIIDDTSGDILYKYYFNGTECVSTEISSGIAESYIAWNLISHDLSCAEEWILLAYQLLEPRDNSKHSKADNVYLPLDGVGKDSVIMSLFISSVTYYGKCFSKAYGNGRRVKLEIKDHVPNHLSDIHKKIIGFRNNIAAHSGDGDWDTGKLKLIEHPSRDEKYRAFVWAELKMLNMYDDQDEKNNYLKLIQAVKKKANDKVSEIGKLILADF